MSLGGGGGGTLIANFSQDTSGNGITTAAWDEVASSLSGSTSSVVIYNGTTSLLKLGYGPAGSEIDSVLIPASASLHVPLLLEAGKRVAIRAVSANATSGFVGLSFLK